MSVTPVPFHTIDHDLDLLVAQEEFGLGSVLRKIHQEHITDYGDDNRDDAFPNEDPTPSLVPANAIHLLQPICEHASETTNGVTNQIEEGISTDQKDMWSVVYWDWYTVVHQCLPLCNFPSKIPH